MTIHDELVEELKDAMRSQDKRRLDVIRQIETEASKARSTKQALVVIQHHIDKHTGHRNVHPDRIREPDQFFVRDNQSTQPRNFWPPVTGGGSTGGGLETVAIVMHLELDGYADIDRVWELPNINAPLNASSGSNAPIGPGTPNEDQDRDDDDDDEP